MSPYICLQLAVCFYLAACIAALSRSARKASALCLLAGTGINGMAVFLQYQRAWPMLPMYLGPPALALCLAVLFLWRDLMHRRDYRAFIWGRERLAALAALTFFAAAAVLFPKDYYLPFLKSRTPFAHLFFVFGTLGKACFVTAAVKALINLSLFKMDDRTAPEEKDVDGVLRWVVWGFALWTLSMFAGEFWSYLGWGTPVVWEDPAITTSMATWFFYACLLHLHLTGTWGIRMRTAYAGAGVLVVFGLNCCPDFGPLRLPF